MIFTKFNEFFNFDYSSILKRVDMTDIQDIMNYLIDEFTGLSYLVENSLQSSIIEPDMKSFIISIYSNGTDKLYYIEPKIFGIITDIDSQLKSMGFEIFYSDFGQTDAWYELVVTEIGNKPKFISSRYDQDGNPR